MFEEHCIKGGFDLHFNSGNPYKIDTQPHLEWKYVVADDRGQRLPCPPLPSNSATATSGTPSNRDVRCPHVLLKLEISRNAGLSLEEIIAVVLYSGPMFVVYNAILRRQLQTCQTNNVYQELVSRQNLFPTTIFVLGSALQKLARCTRIPNGTPLYRGLGGQGKFTLELPPGFDSCDSNSCSGYTDYGFQSWTTDVRTALQYSGVYQSKPGACMLQMQSSSIDRGADIAEFSQFPGESEFTFVPCSFVQRSGNTKAHLVSIGDQFGYLSIVPVRVNVNLKIETLEDLLQKKKTTHLTSFRMLCEESRVKLAALLHDQACGHADGLSLIDVVTKQLDAIVQQHQVLSSNEYADDLKYSQLVTHKMQVIVWSKEKLLLWLESARDISVTNDSSILSLSLAESHRLWQIVLHKKFAAAACGSIERKQTAIQLLQSRGVMNCADANDAVDRIPLVVKAAVENWSASDVDYLLAAFEVRMRPGWSPVMAAAANGHADTLEGLFPHGDANYCDEFGAFPLFVASAYGHKQCVEILLRQPTTLVTKLSSLGFSCLDIARANGHSQCAELLEHHFTSVGEMDMRLCDLQEIILQLLQYFVLRQDARGLANAIHKGANVQSCDPSGQSIINFASGHGAVAAVEALIEFKADVNTSDKDGKSPLGNAKRNGHISCVALLQSAGAALSVLEIVTAGDAKMLEISAELGVDVNMRDSDGLSALHIAALHGHNKCIEILIKLGLNVNASATCTRSHNVSSMWSPLHCAALGSHAQSIELLAAYGANINICNLNGESAMHSAFSGSRRQSAAAFLQCINTLAGLGLDVNARSKRGWTALCHVSCNVISCLSPETSGEQDETNFEQRLSLNVMCIQVLLNSKANANLCDGAGSSPLQLAKQKRFSEVEAVLLAAGAELSIFDAARTGNDVAIKMCILKMSSVQELSQTALCSHMTPLDLALKHGHAEVAAALQAAGAKHSIFVAAASGNASFIDGGSSATDLNVLGDDGNNALHTALLHCRESSHIPFIRALVQASADVNTRNYFGQTPLSIAIGQKSADAEGLMRSLGAKLNIFEAAELDDVVAIQSFVADGGDVNLLDTMSNNRGTALHLAARCANLNCVCALLNLKADVNACDKDGMSPLDCARASFAKTQEVARQPLLFQHRLCSEMLRSGVYESIFRVLQAAGASLSVQEKKKRRSHSITHAVAAAVMQHLGSVALTRKRGGGCLTPDYSLVFDNFNTFVADVQLRGGCFYFEIFVVRCHVSQFGFCSEGFESRDEAQGQGVGDDDKSWGVDGFRVQKWHNNDSNCFGSAWSNGDVIGFAIDMREERDAIMSVSVNGSFKPPNGVAFRSVSAAFLSPAFTASGEGPHDESVPEWHRKPEQYRVNFGQRTFKFSPPSDANYMSVHEYHTRQQRA